MVSASPFIEYRIKAGENFCDKRVFKTVDTNEECFIVRFDSSAIYTTVNPQNQYDINKLYGFSDNNAAHHQFSARFGWLWSNGALRLFAYVYNNGMVQSKELKEVTIGDNISCSLKVTASQYFFTVDTMLDSLPRRSRTGRAKGYQLYPYFGGDETAPHAISIWIKEVK